MGSEESQRATLITTLRRELLARSEIVFAYLHGSFLSGGPYRDIDFDRYLESIGRYLSAEPG